MEARHEPRPMEYDEYGQALGSTLFRLAKRFYSYEALPPNFSVPENCLAGAFAGIAVGLSNLKDLRVDIQTGTLCHVPCRYAKGLSTP